MTAIPISKARLQGVGSGLDEVLERGARVPITRRGKVVAYIVPAADVESLERAEDEEDVRAAEHAIQLQGDREPRLFRDVCREEGWPVPKGRARHR